MWPLSLNMQKKQDLAEVDPEPIPQECRICLGGEETGEEWGAPCHCTRAFVWVHRNCIEWRLKHTKIGEDKRRCAVCKLPYLKGLRLKSLREWYDGWSDRWAFLLSDFSLLLIIHPALDAFHKQAFVFVTVFILLAAIQFTLRICAAYHMPATFGLPLYKRFLAEAVRDRILDAPPPARSSTWATS